MVISDFGMVIILFGILAIPLGILTPIVYEKTQKSKLAVTGLFFIYLILVITSLHRNDCWFENVKGCSKAHTFGKQYDYCFQKEVVETNKTTGLCIYGGGNSCLDIPKGCINQTKANIDGYCLSKFPYLCLLFNPA